MRPNHRQVQAKQKARRTHDGMKIIKYAYHELNRRNICGATISRVLIGLTTDTITIDPLMAMMGRSINVTANPTRYMSAVASDINSGNQRSSINNVVLVK